ncbi:Endothelin-converting enzyme 1 [Amphibalanus amphitrite]|uniref:Endothelin-converting enzyme 1 n=1 Tax=Amphibalanus amphitrite TaxID=1232801 RepID=A0A6A4WFU7_AMPAM|nr:Endothelin-converting enzyme 1 [Amphibalanus amphitrite]
MSGKVDENGGRLDESPERDAMLDGAEPRKRSPGRLSRATDALGLPCRWAVVLVVLLVLVLALLAAVIALAASWPSAPVEEAVSRCESAHCLSAAAQLQAGAVGDDAMACNTFWEHSCSAWVERNPIPVIDSEWGVTQKMRRSAEERLQRILSTLPYVESPRSYLWKLSALYMGCMDRAAHPDRSDLATKLLGVVSSLGGFEPLGKFERQLWNPGAVIRQLHADHNIDVFFRIGVVADPDNGTNNVLQISPGGFGLRDRGHYFREPDDPVVTAYQRYIQDVLLRIGVTVDSAARFAKNMFHYERRLAEASLDPLERSDPASTPHPQRVTVDWLRKESPQIDWLNILRDVYPAGKVTMETEVVLPDQQYVLEVSKIVSSTATSSMNEYLMWRLVDGYLPYLPEADRAALDVLRSELTGVKRQPPHWLTCTRITRQLLPLAAGALLARDEPSEAREHSQRAATELFQSLQQGLGGALTYSRLVSDRNRAAVLHQISSVDLVCGYPAVLLEDKLLDKVYSELNVMRHNFFDSVQAARRHQRIIEQKAYLVPGQEQELEPLLNGASVSYSQAHHTVVVPDYLLRPPLFEPTYPPPFKYGGLGTRLAEALLAAIKPGSLALAEEETNSTVDGGDTMAHNRETFRRCISAALSMSQLEPQTVARVTTSASDQVLALRLALQTMLAHLEEVGDEQLPGLEDMSAEKVFFSAFGQSMCLHKTEEKSQWDEFTKFKVDGKVKLELTVEQAAPFREVFNCNETHAHVLEGPCGFFV